MRKSLSPHFKKSIKRFDNRRSIACELFRVFSSLCSKRTRQRLPSRLSSSTVDLLCFIDFLAALSTEHRERCSMVTGVVEVSDSQRVTPLHYRVLISALSIVISALLAETSGLALLTEISALLAETSGSALLTSKQFQFTIPLNRRVAILALLWYLDDASLCSCL